MLAEADGSARQLLTAVSNVQYVEPGYLVYAREGTLVGQRFDAGRAELTGAPFSLAASVRYFYSTAAARFTAARGALVYDTSFDRDRLVWIDRSGHESGTVSTPGRFISLRISPDGSRLLFSRGQPQIGTFDLWMADLDRGGEQRLTSEPTSEVGAVWSRDGRTAFFTADRLGPPHVFARDLRAGVEREVLPAGVLQTAEDVSPDGKTLAFSDRSNGNSDLWTSPIDRPRERSPVFQSRFTEAQLRFSPDGRFIAFSSNESGRSEVYVAAFPPTGEKSVVSTAGASSPRWSRDGRELFYMSGDRQLMAVAVGTPPALRLGPPRALFGLIGRRIWKDYDVSPDGRRFLAIVTDLLGDAQPLTAVMNPFADAGHPPER